MLPHKVEQQMQDPSDDDSAERGEHQRDGLVLGEEGVGRSSKPGSEAGVVHGEGGRGRDLEVGCRVSCALCCVGL